MGKLAPAVFIPTYSEQIKAACAGTGLFPSVKMAQFILETGWGKSIDTAGNNCFGIKAGKSWPGKVISNTTREVIDGKSIVYKGTEKIYQNRDEAIKAGALPVTLFRAYDNQAESIKDHSKLLLTSDTYKLARNAATPEEQAKLLQKAGYATAPNYATVLISLIRKYDLAQLDC